MVQDYERIRQFSVVVVGIGGVGSVTTHPMKGEGRSFVGGDGGGFGEVGGALQGDGMVLER